MPDPTPENVLTLDASKIVFASPSGAFRVTENDVEAAYDGGRLVFTLSGDDDMAKAAREFLHEEKKINAATVLLNFRKDDPMRAFPVTRVERETRRFTVIIIEEPAV